MAQAKTPRKIVKRATGGAAGETGADKKPVAKKPAAAKAAALKKTPAAPAGAGKALGITPEERYRMIATAAYYRAEKRGFVGGDPVQDWLEAEAEFTKLIGK